MLLHEYFDDPYYFSCRLRSFLFPFWVKFDFWTKNSMFLLNFWAILVFFGDFQWILSEFLVNFECFTWFLMSQNKHFLWKIHKNPHFSTIKKSTFKMCILCTYWIICIWHIWQIGLESQILAPIWNIVLGNISSQDILSTFIKYGLRVWQTHWVIVIGWNSACDLPSWG